MMIDLNNENFVIKAAEYYDIKKAVDADEFYDDLKRFQYIKKLFKKYSENDELNTRLVLNHIIVIFNCFGRNAIPFLFFKLEGYHSYLIPFLLLINQLPETIRYDDQLLLSADIIPDVYILTQLGEI